MAVKFKKHKFVFNGTDHFVLVRGNEIFVLLTSTCKSIGLEPSWQSSRLRHEGVLKQIEVENDGAGHGIRCNCLSIDDCQKWLDSIFLSRVNNDVAIAVMVYRDDFVKAVRSLTFPTTPEVVVEAPQKDTKVDRFIAAIEAALLELKSDPQPVVAPEVPPPEPEPVVKKYPTPQVSGNYYSMTEVGKEIGINAYAIGAFITQLGWRPNTEVRPGIWVNYPTPEMIENGWLRVESSTNKKPKILFSDEAKDKLITEWNALSPEGKAAYQAISPKAWFK